MRASASRGVAGSTIAAMGIQDRDYYRDDAGVMHPRGPALGSAVGRMRYWSVSTWLIAVNVAVYVLDLVFAALGLGYGHLATAAAAGKLVEVFALVPKANELLATGQLARLSPTAMGVLERWGYFSVTQTFGHLQLWRLLTFQFLHAGAWHLLGNMVGLYFFGPLVEEYLGRRRFLAFYLLSGVAGPILSCGFAAAGLLHTAAYTPLIGASAGIFGILIASAVIAPNDEILVYGVLPVRLKVAALVLLGFAAYMVFTNGRNAGGEAAHLGGAAVGYLLIRHADWLDWAERLVPKRLLGTRGGTRMKYHGWR